MLNETEIRAKLDDLDLRLVFEPEDRSYRLEYFSVAAIDPASRKRTPVRRHQLHHRATGAVINECWGPYDSAEQARILFGLLSYTDYRLIAETRGWRARCSTCDSHFTGKHWDAVPTTCSKRGCGGAVDLVDDDAGIDAASIESGHA